MGFPGMVVTSMLNLGSPVASARGAPYIHQVARARGILGPATAVLSRACTCRSPPRRWASPRPRQAPVLITAGFLGPATAAQTRAYRHLCFLPLCLKNGALRPNASCIRPLQVRVPLPRGHANVNRRRHMLLILRLWRAYGTRGQIPSQSTTRSPHHAVKIAAGMPHPPAACIYTGILVDAPSCFVSPISGVFV